MDQLSTGLKTALYIVILIICAFLSLPLVGQETIISGTLPGAESIPVRLSTFDDLVSQRKITLDLQTTDSSGYIKMRTEIVSTHRLFLEVSFYESALFAEPGKSYDLSCDSLKIKGEYRPLYNRESLPCHLSDETGMELNQKITAFDALYNEFVMEEFGGIYQRRNLNVIRTFEARTDSLFGVPGEDFFSIYREYKVAALKLAIAPSRKNKLFNTYLKNRTLHYDNPEFIYFFSQFFNHHLTYNNRFISRFEVRSWVNSPLDYAAIEDSLGKDTLLRNEKIRELVWLINLKSLYHEPDFSKTNILGFLNLMEKESKFPEHKKIAGNLYVELTKHETGFPAPVFRLPDLEGDTVGLIDLSGKPVYIGFMNTLSFASLAEFERMDSLYSKYGSQVHFVTISMDPDPQVIRRFKKEKEYNWTFLYNGLDLDLTDRYELQTLPVFILIDSNGKILQYPARKPSEGISESIERYIYHR